ncbi:MAG: branched-chain amino acid aminotransferase [Alphaproteobacteria bacterium]
MDKLVYYDGQWYDRNPAIMGPLTQSVWMATAVFDGARAFDRVAPDLDRHCERLIESARVMGLKPTQSARQVYELAWDGILRFPPETELYIRPMFYAEEGFVLLDPDSTRFTLSLLARPLAKPTGFSACLATQRRPAPDMAPTLAKAACLYPNVGFAMRAANAKGFETAVMLDAEGHVAEFATSNLFFVKDGAVHTPKANGTFLNGVTRQRVIQLLRDAGHEVLERSVTYQELLDADELFSTGNLNKVLPATRIEDRNLQPGPVFKRARELYFEFARSETRR